MLNKHTIHTAARISRIAATKAALRELGAGSEVTVRTFTGDLITAKIVDIGLRTVWLVDGNARDHVLRYESVVAVGGI